jgi:BASS family bile acid:Na+ symporter
MLGSVHPSALLWVNTGNIISFLLALVMVAMGMTLEAKDFSTIFTRDSYSWRIMIPTGVACQYGIMPLAAWFVGRSLLLPPSTTPHQPQALALFLGLVLVGSAPGGTASNLVSFIAGADVALSVILTAISTLLASLVTPFMVQLLLGQTIRIHGQALMAATAQVVLLPVLLGMILKAQLPALSRIVSRFASFASVLFVSLICGGVVSNHSDIILSLIQNVRTQGISSILGGHEILPKIISSVLLLHTLGFSMGYIIPRWVVGLDEKTSRTMSIETGMQNSALAVVLAKSLGADPIACLPGAFSATVHSCLGSMLAVYWRWVDGKRGRTRE